MTAHPAELPDVAPGGPKTEAEPKGKPALPERWQNRFPAKAGHTDPEDRPAVISVKALQKSYTSAAPVLRGVTATIRTGERVALIGSNGSGKSTLLKCLIGLHPLSGGTVETLGEAFGTVPTASQRKRLRHETGFVFQRHCLVKRRSVLSNVLHGMLSHQGGWRAVSHGLAPREWRERALAALDDVNLADKAPQRADALSGGQQQRVAIARALVSGPKLLIADEPAASLDPASGRDVMALFSDLCTRDRITLLFTSHDMDHAVSFSDRVIALKHGVVLFDKKSCDVTQDDLSAVFDG